MKRALTLISLAGALSLFGGAPVATADPITVKYELPKKLGHMLVPVKINGRAVVMGFDTGSPFTFFGTGSGMNGGNCRIEIGDLKVDNFNVSVMPVAGSTAEGMVGLIGHTFLSRFRYVIDFQKHEITFDKPGSGAFDRANTGAGVFGGGGVSKSAPVRRIVLGAVMEDLGEDTHEARIISVAAGSAADEGGLKRGDKITSCNERRVVKPKEVFEAIGPATPGQALRLKVERNGRELELTLKTRAGL